MVVGLFYVAATRKYGLARMLSSHYDLSWTAVRYYGYVRTLLRYYNIVQVVARSGGDGGDGRNGGDEEQANISILSEATTKEAGEAVLRQEAKQRARTQSSVFAFVLNNVIMHDR